MRKVILAGAGQIGFRHLQSLSQLSGDTQVHVYDTSAERLEFCASSMDWNAAPAKLVTHKTLDTLPVEADLLVVATSSAPRRQVFEDIVARSQVSRCVFEKVLFQRRGDLDAVAEALRQRSIAAWVNCTRRTWPGYQELQGRLAGAGPLHMQVQGGEWGLACNSIHFIDIFCLLSGEAVASVGTSGLQLPAIESKRPGYIEFLGSLDVQYERGSTLRMSSAPASAGLRISTRLEAPGLGLRFEIDEAGQAIRSEPLGSDDAALAPSAAFPIRHTSQLSEQYEAILSGSPTWLTGYAESAAQHERLLLAFQQALGLRQDEPCLIT